MLDRREFVRFGLAGFACGTGLLKSTALQSADADPSPFPIVDSHTHFYDPTRPQGVPWPSKDDAVLYRPILPKEFQTLTKPFRVTGTVIIEASSWVEDNQWLLDLAQDNPFILGIVGNLNPGTEPFAMQLNRFKSNPLFKGIRIGSDAVQQGLERPEFLKDLKSFSDANLELDVNGGIETPLLVDRLAARFPQLRIAINHLANLQIDGKEPPAEWQSGMAAAAKHKNVFLKVSALIGAARGSDQKPPTNMSFYAPVLNAAWKIFGEDRLIYGSDWPVSDLAGPYRLVLQIVREFFDDKGRVAKEKFFAGNSQVAYNWSKRS